MGQLTSESSTDDGLTGRSSEPNLSGVSGFNDAPEGNGNGVYGQSVSAKGAGVKGVNSAGVGVRGKSTQGVGVWGQSTQGDGVYGENDHKIKGAEGAIFAAVRGRAQDCTGVWGESKGNHGVRGETATNTCSGVYGINYFKQEGLYKSTEDTGAGVTGYAENVAGVFGQSKYDTGISGKGGEYGGRFDGEMAQIWLIPGPTKGHPTDGPHRAGELYLDKDGDLFLCKKSGDGKKAIWTQIG